MEMNEPGPTGALSSGSVVMSVTKEDSLPPTASQSQQCVEEEYTIQVPLVQPNPRFQEVLRLAGATKETFTKKEICHYLKDYISSRQLYDIGDPRIVHCGEDILGEVFGVKQFTIDEVLGLLDRNCTELPDRCMRRKRRIISPPIPLSTSSSSMPLRITVCYPDTHGTSTSLIDSTTFQRDLKFKSKSTGSTFVTCSQDRARNQTVRTGECRVSSTCPRKSSTSEETSSEGTKSQKRKKKSKHNNSSSPRKRNHTEPSTSDPQPQTASGSSVRRRRGTSLSITCGTSEGGDGKGEFPWYFQVEVSDECEADGEEDKSEVLSVQGKETVTIKDSTDDLWFVEDALESDVEFSVEYEVESDSPEPTDSDGTSIRSGESGGLLVVCKESDVEFFADYSESESNTDDKELSEADNWICNECQLSNQPYQRYCDRCWKLRADWLPTGPSYYDLDAKPKQNTVPNTKVSTISSSAVSESKVKSEVLGSEIKDKISDRPTKMNETTDSGFGSSTQPSSQETVADIPENTTKLLTMSTLSSTSCSSLGLDLAEQRCSFSNITLAGEHKPTRTPLDDPCIICMVKPKTASLIHGLSGHQVCCYTCAKRLKRRGKACPVCRRPVQKVVKNYIL